MNSKITLSTITYILIVFFLSSCASTKRMDSWKQLTLVDDPIEFQNPFFPLSIENYWKYDMRSQNVIGNLVPSGTLEFKVADYIFDDFYLGDSLVYAPLFRLDGVYRSTSGQTNEAESYALKTNQGIVLIDGLPEDSTLNIFRFVPTSNEYFHLFPGLYDISFVEADSSSPNPVIFMINKTIGSEKIYYEKNIGLVRMVHDRYDKKRFRNIIENDYNLIDYQVK